MQQSSDEKTDWEQKTSNSLAEISEASGPVSELPKLEVLTDSDMRNWTDLTSEIAGSISDSNFWHYCRKVQLRLPKRKYEKQEFLFVQALSSVNLENIPDFSAYRERDDDCRNENTQEQAEFHYDDPSDCAVHRAD